MILIATDLHFFTNRNAISDLDFGRLYCIFAVQKRRAGRLPSFFVDFQGGFWAENCGKRSEKGIPTRDFGKNRSELFRFFSDALARVSDFGAF